MIGSVNALQLQSLKRQLGIETTLAINYVTYESGSNKVIERGHIEQDACGELKKKIISVMTGSIGYTIIRLIYTTWPEKEPTIKRIRYESSK